MVTVSKLSQPLNALFPMDVTLSGMVISVIFELLNALSGRLVMFLPSVTVLSFLAPTMTQFQPCFVPYEHAGISVTPSPK